MSWAIEAHSPGGRRYLIGYGLVSWIRPVHFGGYTIATWQTRSEAREFCRRLSDGWAEAKYCVVKVRVKVARLEK